MNCWVALGRTDRPCPSTMTTLSNDSNTWPFPIENDKTSLLNLDYVFYMISTFLWLMGRRKTRMAPTKDGIVQKPETMKRSQKQAEETNHTDINQPIIRKTIQKREGNQWNKGRQQGGGFPARSSRQESTIVDRSTGPQCGWRFSIFLTNENPCFEFHTDTT